MAAPKEYVLTLVAESEKDVGRRDYVSEGIYAVARALNDDKNTVPRVVSTDILGPTWFGREQREFSPGVMTGPGPATREYYEAGVASGAIMSLETMQSRVLDPSWRLTEKAAEVMTDFGFLKQAPILNLLNGFEYMMDNNLRAAAELAQFPEKEENRPSWLVDAGFLLKEKDVSVADVAVGRARRIVAVFCYTLIDILKWKRAMTERVAALNFKPFPSMPQGAPYSSLINKISERGKKFVEGMIEEEAGTSNFGKRYVLPSVTTVLASAVATGFSPRIGGTFYEAILGYDIMTELSRLISAEYGALLSRITGPGGPVNGRLETYVSDPDAEIPSHKVTEDEKVWIAKERERRSNLEDWQLRAENAVKSHEYLGSAIDMEPFLNKDKTTINETAAKALHREVRREIQNNNNNPEESILRVCSRQPFFSNFSVMRVRPFDSANRLSMYNMWNTLFLATGGITSATASANGVRSRLLFQFFLKDLHALFSCTRCEYGFLMKILDTFSLWENEKTNEGEGQRELIRVLSAALSALTGKTDAQKTTVGQLVYQILAYVRPGDKGVNAAALSLSGKMRLNKEDREMRELFTTDQTAYALEARKYTEVSKGFAALAFYCLYASAASAPHLSEKTSSSRLDKAVIPLLSRWGNQKFPAPKNLWREEEEEVSSAPSLLAFAGVWALRNAVRARRNVHDATNASFIPGRPLTLFEALPMLKSIRAILNNKYVHPNNIDSEKLVWKATAEMETESEVWLSSSRKTGREMITLGRAKLVKEPAGLVPVTSSVNLLFPKRSTAAVTQEDAKHDKKKRVFHPLTTVDEISLSIDDLKSFSKETYSKIPSFPITALDF